MNEPRRRRFALSIFWPRAKKGDRRGVGGLICSVMNWIAPGTRRSPLRRVVQLVCLGMFLYAFFYVCWPYSEQFSKTTFSDKESYPVEMFLSLDPLVGIATAIAGREFVLWTMVWTGVVLLVCVIVPRFFCGYLCPLGTLIDCFDGVIGRPFRKLQVRCGGRRSGWKHAKYYLLGGVLAAALGGVMLAGFVSPICILTRGLLLTAGRWELAHWKDTSQLTAFDATFYFAVAILAFVIFLSLLGRRFWCRYLCPSGVVLSALSPLRLTERRVSEKCIGCGACVDACSFDAVKDDYSTRTADCTMCQACGGVCPTRAIEFGLRGGNGDKMPVAESPRGEAAWDDAVSRREFVLAAGIGAAAALGVRYLPDETRAAPLPIRPPGSVPEGQFLQLCIRCGECFKVCPGPVLRPGGKEDGFEAMWTPIADFGHAGCHQDCNFCTQVCPTGAIRPLDIMLKRKTVMGVAEVNTSACIAHQGEKFCDLCYKECRRAGYDAIELRQIDLEVDVEAMIAAGMGDFIDEASHIDAPFVDLDKCVGCGICQYLCHTRLVVQEERLEHSAIVVRAHLPEAEKRNR